MTEVLTYPLCDEMPLSVFEAYFIHGRMAGYPEEHWEKVIEQYDELIGEKNGSDTKYVIARHTEYVLKYNAWMTALQAAYNLFTGEPPIYSTQHAKLLSEQFKGLSFSKETILKDIERAQTRLKTQLKKIKEFSELLPTGEEQPINATYFDEIIFAYGEVFQVPAPPKDSMKVQAFAVLYKRLKDRIENEQSKNTRHDG